MGKILLMTVLAGSLTWAGALTPAGEKGEVFVGKAGWYGARDRTDPWPHVTNADGTPFDENAYTCAMRRRPFGSVYKVTNLDTGKSVIVTHRDYGPARQYKGKKITATMDLSKAAFKKIADLETGLIPVRVERITKKI